MIQEALLAIKTVSHYWHDQFLTSLKTDKLVIISNHAWGLPPVIQIVCRMPKVPLVWAEGILAFFVGRDVLSPAQIDHLLSMYLPKEAVTGLMLFGRYMNERMKTQFIRCLDTDEAAYILRHCPYLNEAQQDMLINAIQLDRQVSARVLASGGIFTPRQTDALEGKRYLYVDSRPERIEQVSEC